MELLGAIKLSKRLLNHPVAERDDYLAKWVYLLLSANDAAREALVHGQRVQLKRGQLFRSLIGLEREWNKSGEWIARFMDFCRDNGMARFDVSRRGAVITVLNYEVYNPVTTATETVIEPAIEPGGEPATETVIEPERNREMGTGNRKGEGAAARVVSFDQAWEWMVANDSGYSAAQVREQWLYYDAMRCPVTGEWQRPTRTGAMIRVTDWRSELSGALAKFATGGAGQPVEKNGGGETAGQRLFRLDQRIKELEAQIDGFEATQPELAERLEKELEKVRAERALHG